MGKIICIDTHVLIWGIKKDASSTQTAMIERTVNFLHWLQNERQTVIVPAPVLGEFLMKVPLSEQDNVSREIQSRFIVLPYDAVAASKFAQIWQTNSNNGMPSGNSNREKLKTDSMIVAIAVVNKGINYVFGRPRTTKICKRLYRNTRYPPTSSSTSITRVVRLLLWKFFYQFFLSL